MGRKAISEVKKLFKLYEKKRTLEKELDEICEERDRISNEQAVVFLISASIFIFSILVGIFLLREDPLLYKIFGGFLLGIPAGMIVYLFASSKWGSLDSELEEMDKKISEVKKKIREIEREMGIES